MGHFQLAHLAPPAGHPGVEGRFINMAKAKPPMGGPRAKYSKGPKAREVEAFKRHSEYISRWLTSMATQHGGRGKPSPYTYEELRALVKKSPVLSAMMSTRMNQLRWVCSLIEDPTSRDRTNHLGWSIVHDRHFEDGFTVTNTIKERCRKVQELFETPHPKYETSFLNFIVKLLKDHVILDRPVIEIINGSDGLPSSMVPVDGATILPLDYFLRAWISKNYGQGNPVQSMDQVYQDVWKDSYLDIQNAAYVQIVDGMLSNVFTANQLHIAISNPSTDVYRYGFGESLVELSAPAAIAWQNAWTYNEAYWKQGLTTDMIIALTSELGPDDEAVEDLKDALLVSHSGVENAHRIPVVGLPLGGELKGLPLKNTARDMEYVKLLQVTTFILCAIWRMDPQEINIPDKFQGSSSLSEGSREQEIALAEEQGLHSILTFFARDLFTPIIKRVDPDLRWAWMGLEEDSEERETELRLKRVQSWETLNEARDESGKKPLNGDLKPEDWADMPAPMAQQAFIMLLNQQAQQEQQGAMGGAPGQAPGGDAGPGGAVPPEVMQRLQGGAGGAPGVGGAPGGGAVRSPVAKALEIPEIWAPEASGDDNSLFVY